MTQLYSGSLHILKHRFSRCSLLLRNIFLENKKKIQVNMFTSVTFAGY